MNSSARLVFYCPPGQSAFVFCPGRGDHRGLSPWNSPWCPASSEKASPHPDPTHHRAASISHLHPQSQGLGNRGGSRVQGPPSAEGGCRSGWGRPALAETHQGQVSLTELPAAGPEWSMSGLQERRNSPPDARPHPCLRGSRNQTRELGLHLSLSTWRRK